MGDTPRRNHLILEARGGAEALTYLKTHCPKVQLQIVGPMDSVVGCNMMVILTACNVVSPLRASLLLQATRAIDGTF